jgi:hypothetical protein
MVDEHLRQSTAEDIGVDEICRYESYFLFMEAVLRLMNELKKLGITPQFSSQGLQDYR